MQPGLPDRAGMAWRRAGAKSRLLALALLLGLCGAPALAAGLPAPLQQALSGQRLSADHVSLWVQRLDDPQPLIAHRVDQPRNAASLTKLLTSLAALERLGPAHRWETRVHALRDPQAPGRAALLIRGGGDPLLQIEDVWRLAQRLRRAGIDTQVGPLLLDDSYFSTTHPDPAAFNSQPLRVYNQPPHPLLVNYNAVWFHVSAEAGGVSVTPDPPLPGLRLRNRLRLAPGPCGGFQRGVAINVTAPGVIELDGEYPDRCGDGYALARRVVEPEDYLRELWSLVWAQWGGRVEAADPALHPGDDPGALEPVAAHASRTLAELLAAVNKSSSNVITRQIKMTLAAEAGLREAAEGRALILATLRGLGVALDGVVFDNAAGLSRTQRITVRQLAAVLEAGRRHVHAPEFLASLSLLGVDGTLRERRIDHPLAGRGRLKTGSLSDVSALAGYVRARSGEDYLLVLIVNAEAAHRGPGEVLQNAVLDWIDAR
jgi:serine-type D-Ala-D-Ala carboxypeptidase/endopeptidase (penicillin-binding protein 4)